MLVREGRELVRVVRGINEGREGVGEGGERC